MCVEICALLPQHLQIPVHHPRTKHIHLACEKTLVLQTGASRQHSSTMHRASHSPGGTRTAQPGLVRTQAHHQLQRRRRPKFWVERTTNAPCTLKANEACISRQRCDGRACKAAAAYKGYTRQQIRVHVRQTPDRTAKKRQPALGCESGSVLDGRGIALEKPTHPAADK